MLDNVPLSLSRVVSVDICILLHLSIENDIVCPGQQLTPCQMQQSDLNALKSPLVTAFLSSAILVFNALPVLPAYVIGHSIHLTLSSYKCKHA